MNIYMVYISDPCILQQLNEQVMNEFKQKMYLLK